jgi:hypothetical protein
MVARSLAVFPAPMPSSLRRTEGILDLPRIRLEFIDADQLTEATLDALHAVASESLKVCRSFLARKLQSFDRIILFRDTRSSALAGCTGLKIIDVEQAGRGARIIYTGAVFLAEAWRGKNLIQRAGVASMLRYGLTLRRLYWLSECDSFRAYLMAVRNCRDVWPRHDAEAPAFETALLETVCPNLFEGTWDPETWVCAAISERRLKHEVAVVPEPLRERDPDAAFFVERNPGYLEAEGLTMLARLSPRSALDFVASILGRRRRR